MNKDRRVGTPWIKLVINTDSKGLKKRQPEAGWPQYSSRVGTMFTRSLHLQVCKCIICRILLFHTKIFLKGHRLLNNVFPMKILLEHVLSSLPYNTCGPSLS